MMNYTVFQPYPYLYHINDPMGVFFTLITGKTKAIVFDTGYGIHNPRKFIEEIITTPYIVINSHGHMDHSGGNYLFDEVRIHPQDVSLCHLHNQEDRRKRNLESAIERKIIDASYDQKSYLEKREGNLLPIAEGEIFDLGNIHVKVIAMEGHTTGSIGLLIEEERLLLTGDAAISMIWLFLNESTDRKTYLEMLMRVRQEPFDHFLTGHIGRVFPKHYFDYYIEVAKKATPENSFPITFKGFERPNTYQYRKTFEDDVIGIVYQEPKQ